jgi:hydrogenase maturation protease
MTVLNAAGSRPAHTAGLRPAAGVHEVPDGRVVVIGVGNEFRRDDGAGPAVIRRLLLRVPRHVELITCDGESARLIDAWSGSRLAIVVDAVRAVPPRPGRLHRFALDRPNGGPRSASSHGLGLDEAVALALALDRMPGRLIVHAVEAGDLGQGTGLTRAVASAVDSLTEAVMRDIRDR